jgi:hypothetical protein
MGAVYLLGNPAMPTFYKIGMSKGCPFARARQLSSSSGIPEQFDVLCHIATNNPLRDEQELHQYLADFRNTGVREFFRFAPVHMPWVVGLFKHHPAAQSFYLAEGTRRTRYLPMVAIENPWASLDECGNPDMTPYAPDYAYGWATP